jgi:alpha-1,6-mannosyltransferase
MDGCGKLIRLRAVMRSPEVTDIHQADRGAQALPCEIPPRRLSKCISSTSVCFILPALAESVRICAPSRASLHKLQAIGIRQARHQPLGVDTEIFAPGRRDPWLKRRLGLPADCRLLVYAGRFSREKNLAALIAAVEHLGHPYHLLLIGGGSRISASGRVSCLPYQQDASALASLIGGADAFVHPGQHETFGLVVLEAMACSLPVLGVEGGGVAELVDADTGLLAESGSSASLAEGISSLFSADLPAMGRRARQKAVVRYGWDCIMPQLMRHYETLLGSGQVRLAGLASLRTETR